MESNREPDYDSPRVMEFIKKAVGAGLGAAFMTEESIRHYVSELKLPKETLNTVLQGAQKSKEEMVNKVGNEIVRIISRIDFVAEASKFVEEHKFKINAEIEVVKKSDGGKSLSFDLNSSPDK